MSWQTVARKEYAEHVRNAWIVTVAAVFLVLTVGMSAFASLGEVFGGGDVRLAGVLPTIIAMEATTGFLLPIIAIMLAFGALAGERESGSLGLLVAQPLTRGEILAGKAVGLWGVLATAVVLGVGIGGGIVLAASGFSALALGQLATFLVDTLLWGAAWIAITLLVSAFFDRRGTAIGGAIGTWFLFAVVWDVLVIVLVLAVVGPQIMGGAGAIDVPEWILATQVLNPNSAYEWLLFTTIDGYSTLTTQVGGEFLPAGVNWVAFAAAMLAWIALPAWGAYALFRAKDV